MAQHYPLGMMHDEAAVVDERLKGTMATEAILIQQAIASVLDKKAAKLFTETVKRLTDGD